MRDQGEQSGTAGEEGVVLGCIVAPIIEGWGVGRGGRGDTDGVGGGVRSRRDGRWDRAGRAAGRAGPVTPA
ncbi:hypothetical protein GCM10009793_31550 [Brachybacterium phenoliresistens]